MSINLVFVRHAQGTHNVGHGNDPMNFDAILTPVGHQQTKENMLTERFDAIYCSPLRRCRATLLGIYPDSENTRVIMDDRLMEQPCGINICDKRLDKSKMVFPNAWDSSKVADITPWKYDEYADLEKIKSFTKELLTNHRNQNILIVSHGNWIYKWFKIYTKHDVQLPNCKSVRISGTV
jgi:broad specificity phosphatase PhoE